MISEEQLQCLKVATDKVQTLDVVCATRKGGGAMYMYFHQELCDARAALQSLAKAVYEDNIK